MTTGEQVVAEAKKYYGLKYVYGGTSLVSGVDCSGFAQQVHKQLGMDIPRDTVSQMSGAPALDWQKAGAGDLVYFGKGGSNAGPNGHVGILLTRVLAGDNGTMINTRPSNGGSVRNDTFSHLWGSSQVIGYRRYYAKSDGPGNDSANPLDHLGPIDNPVNTVTDALDVAKSTANALASIASLPIKVATWFADKHNIVRIAQFMLGIMAMMLGFYITNADTINAGVGKAVDLGSKAAKLAAL